MAALPVPTEQPKFVKIFDAASPVVAHINKLYRHDGKFPAGIPTGFMDIDAITLGMLPGDLIVLAGRPSMGKSSLALNIASNISLGNNLPVALINTDTGNDEVVRRLLSSMGGLCQEKLRSGFLGVYDCAKLQQAAKQLKDAPLQIYSSHTPSIELIQELMHQQALQNSPLCLLIVDNLTAMLSHPQEYNPKEITEAIVFLKELAVQYQIAVLLVVETNRNLEQREDKRPVLSDLPHYRTLVANADLVLFIYRDEVYTDNSPDKGTAEIHIRKHRKGAAARTRLVFQAEYGRFENFDSTKMLGTDGLSK